MSTAARTGDNEVTILARVFDDERGVLPRQLARSIVDVDFSEHDKARMHDLAVRNQDDALSPAEKEELHAFAKAGTLLSILHRHVALHSASESPSHAEDQTEETYALLKEAQWNQR